MLSLPRPPPPPPPNQTYTYAHTPPLSPSARPSRVLHCDDDLIVVNKPPGLPCMRHESNATEELAACVGKALGVEGLEVRGGADGGGGFGGLGGAWREAEIGAVAAAVAHTVG